MRAIKLKMRAGCGTSNNLLEIDSIYLTGCDSERYYKKEALHDYLKKNPNTIQVNIYPFPQVIPALSANNEKYVKSTPNSSTNDNLLGLPRE